jgi:uncharacterized 2Fe-2S/4Fe-4S cluster protein (DUF4445 family)
MLMIVPSVQKLIEAADGVVALPPLRTQRIGLLETDPDRVIAVGNAALRGARLILAAKHPVLHNIEHIDLASDSPFRDKFVGCLGFPMLNSYASANHPPRRRLVQ